VAPELARSASEAERRRLAAIFYDFSDSITLSQPLDLEVLREVVRAYRATAAEVIRQFGGHMARHLWDGLLTSFGCPVSHEDHAQHALHAGMGIVQAMPMTLNPRLEQEKIVKCYTFLGADVYRGKMLPDEVLWK
jgi:class 3 adenylate cyclase